MMELPESYSLSRQINEALSGKKISSIEILHTPHKFTFFKSDPSSYPELLIGKTITDSTCKGGMLEIDTNESMIVFSDGITPRFYASPKEYPKSHQFAMIFDDATALFCSVRMYGFIDVCALGNCREEYYISSSTKPNPMTEGFTYRYFKSLYQGEAKLSAKGFLATEQRIPGIGNGVIQDVLWKAGIDPRFKMCNASEEDFHNLYNALVDTVQDMCSSGGRDCENDIFGNPGGYHTLLSKKTLGTQCPKCGTPIVKAAYMGGTVYYCDYCQKK